MYSETQEYYKAKFFVKGSFKDLKNYVKLLEKEHKYKKNHWDFDVNIKIEVKTINYNARFGYIGRFKDVKKYIKSLVKVHKIKKALYGELEVNATIEVIGKVKKCNLIKNLLGW